MTFSTEAWARCEPIYQRIIHHPFNTALAAGTLEQGRFVHYMQQDSIYLIDFSRALANIGARVEREQDTLALIQFAQGAIAAERELHAHYFEQFGIEPATEKNPACFAYTHFLLAAGAVMPVPVAIAAILPCFWIYREVGNTIARQTVANNPYQAWIDTYSDPEFSATVDRAIAICDRVAGEASASQQARMHQAFRDSTLMEWHFWNDAYQQQSFEGLMQAPAGG